MLKRGTLFLTRDMIKIILSVLTQWRVVQWMFLHLMVSDTCSVVTVNQPRVLAAALGHDALMPCQLSLSRKLVTPPVLYWIYLVDDKELAKVWKPNENYVDRVDILDSDPLSLNKSILLKNVQWDDSGKYQCKLSVTTETDERFREKGNGTLLMIYDTPIFTLTGHNNTMLQCEVNVTSEPGFVLSIFTDGHKSQTVNSSSRNHSAALPYITLSETILWRSTEKYECQLHLNEDLITKSTFYHHLSTEPDAEVYPEPWSLYVSLLLVPVVILLALLMAMLIHRR